MNHLLFCIFQLAFSGWQMDDYQDITNDVSVSQFEEIKNYILRHGTHSPHRIYDTEKPFVAFDSIVLYVTGRNIHGEFLKDPNMICILDNNYSSGTTTHYTLLIVRKEDAQQKDLATPKFMKEEHVYLRWSSTEKSIPDGRIILKNKIIPLMLGKKQN